MRVIIVDDERMAILSMEKLLQDLGPFDIVGTYQNPYEALTRIEAEQPDLVFLDIDMPELNGLELAERIQNVSPQIEIVFATAYDDFAVKAFELHALDYVLKPVQRERLAKTIQRIRERHKELPAIPDNTVSTFNIRCFQSLEFEKSGGSSEIIPLRWRTTKTQELFIYLLHNRNKVVRKDVLLDQLWPEVEWKKGFAQLYTAIYQIRKMMDSIGIPLTISSHDGGYQLNLNNVSLDVDLWEQGIREGDSISTSTLDKHLQLLALYRGDYLADYDYLWAEGERQRLKSLWFHHASQIVEQLVLIEKYAEAIDISHRIQLLHPHMEESYFILMRLYAHQEDRDTVEQQYQRLVEMLKKEFDLEPQEYIRTWYHHWQKKH